MKSYTDIEQSKKLAEILPLESADMEYIFLKENNVAIGNVPFVKDDSEVENSGFDYIYNRTPCWSLSALLKHLNESVYFINEAGAVELSSVKATKWCVSILNCGKIENCYADSPIDACVAIIEKLHELKML